MIPRGFHHILTFPLSELSSKLVLSKDTIVPSAGGVAPAGTRTMSPTSRRSAGIFSTTFVVVLEEWMAALSDLFMSLVNGDVVGSSLVNRRASELRNLPRRAIALAALCLLKASMKRPII